MGQCQPCCVGDSPEYEDAATAQESPKSRTVEKSVEFEDVSENGFSDEGRPRKPCSQVSLGTSGNASGSASLRQVSQATLDSLMSKPSFLEDQEASDVDEQELLGRTDSKPFAGHPSFKGPFSAEDATRAGFYSIVRLPEVGDEVVCFQRNHWLKRGTVEDVQEEVSNGHDGLKAGVTGAWVTVKQQDGSLYHSWAVFLATASDQEYSSVCLQAEFENSNFFKLRRTIYGDTVTHQTRVTKAQAKASLEAWLQNCIDADGNAVEISPEMRKELLDIFDSNQEDPSLHLYSLHKRLGPRTDARKGRDYSLYYQALNNTLNHDTSQSLRPALPLIRRMTYLLLYDEKTGEKRLHEGGRVWKGDSERPVPLNKQRLKLAFRHQVPIRFRQFQSTTSDQKVAARFQKREDRKGFLWIIDIPAKYFGARNIQDISSRSKESETLFPPYSAFEVLALEEDSCHLRALPYRYEEEEEVSKADSMKSDHLNVPEPGRRMVSA
ncbi:unnamed protein product [Symbiodinium natans]|uniref:Mono(ADP-ribosyl)transferase n=1 Tax=Symbiodinium natans TaxID=878477 RepID=A0A812L0T5_9DINO|nr:unnamed protein product [Symbiodinium natans]